MHKPSFSVCLLTLCIAALAGCQALSGTYPRSGSLIPDTGVQITPDYRLTLPDLVLIAGALHLMYQVVDPQAPAWDIREGKLTDGRVLYRLQMQQMHNGGEGEARLVLARRARALAQEQGATGYEILRYEESIDSRLFLPRRHAEAEIRLLRAGA